MNLQKAFRVLGLNKTTNLAKTFQNQQINRYKTKKTINYIKQKNKYTYLTNEHSIVENDHFEKKVSIVLNCLTLIVFSTKT